MYIKCIFVQRRLNLKNVFFKLQIKIFHFKCYTVNDNNIIYIFEYNFYFDPMW